MAPIQFTSDSFPNVHLEIINDQVWLRVSLNIPNELIGYLPKGNIFKAKNLHVFVVSARIKGQISTDKLDTYYNNCMRTAMSKVREAKQIHLQKQIKNIRTNGNSQLQLSFNRNS